MSYFFGRNRVGLVPEQTFQENKNPQQQINQSVLQALDGYAQDISFQENKNAQQQINQNILQSLDGYDLTFQENKNAQQQINQTILQSLDGYALSASLSGLDLTFQENKNAQQQINQTILQSLDGYDLTFQENKNAQQQINQTILQSLDGYDLTFQENKNAQQQINQTILQSLDGYDLTFQENKNAQQQINQSILQSLDGYVITSGFIDRTSSSLSFTDLTRTFTITPIISFSVFTSGKKHTYISAQSKIISATIGLHYVYFDDFGAIQESLSSWVITETTTAPCAIIYWNGTAGILYDERHGYTRNVEWHSWAHNTIGTRYESGLTGTFATATTSIAPGVIRDEDIDSVITPAQTSVRLWYRAVGAATMTFDAATSLITAKVAAGSLKYDNAGTLTNASVNNYVVNWAYATNATSVPIMVVVGQAQYTLITSARAAPLPTFPNLPTVEFKVIYQVIWRNAGGTPTYIESTDYRTAGPLPSGGITTPPAGAITFSSSGNISAQNVQAAIEELDDEKTAELTFIENKNAQQQINQTILQSLDGYARADCSWTNSRPRKHTNCHTTDR